MQNIKIPGVFWITLIAGLMVALPKLGLDVSTTAIIVTLLGAVAKALQMYLNVPDEDMPPMPEFGNMTPAASPYTAPPPEASHPSVARQFFLG